MNVLLLSTKKEERADTNFFSLQNVLRELEQKKPQLDDLVKTAENLKESPIKQQIPAKGKKKIVEELLIR